MALSSSFLRPVPPPRKKSLQKQDKLSASSLLQPPIDLDFKHTHRLTKLKSYAFIDEALDEVPETSIGIGVNIQGELRFDRLLRIDGSFVGRLVSSGNLIIGSSGCLVGDVTDMSCLLLDGGKLSGNATVDRLVLKNQAVMRGNVNCKRLEVENNCTIIGRVNAHYLSPEIIDEDGDIIKIEKAGLRLDDDRSTNYSDIGSVIPASNMVFRGGRYHGSLRRFDKRIAKTLDTANLTQKPPQITPNPSQIAPNLSQIAPNPPQKEPKPSKISPKPSDMEPKPSRIEPSVSMSSARKSTMEQTPRIEHMTAESSSLHFQESKNPSEKSMSAVATDRKVSIEEKTNTDSVPVVITSDTKELTEEDLREKAAITIQNLVRYYMSRMYNLHQIRKAKKQIRRGSVQVGAFSESEVDVESKLKAAALIQGVWKKSFSRKYVDYKKRKEDRQKRRSSVSGAALVIPAVRRSSSGSNSNSSHTPQATSDVVSDDYNIHSPKAAVHPMEAISEREGGAEDAPAAPVQAAAGDAAAGAVSGVAASASSSAQAPINSASATITPSENVKPAEAATAVPVPMPKGPGEAKAASATIIPSEKVKPAESAVPGPTPKGPGEATAASATITPSEK